MALAQVDINDVIKSNEGAPINISSGSLVMKNSENLSIFEDNVKVTQGDMILKSDQMKVYSDYDKVTKKSKFRKIEAAGNVDFVSGDKSAKSDHAVYDIKEGQLVLRDNVRLKDSESSLQGKVFEYNVKTGLSKISNSGTGRISVSSDKNSNADSKTPASTTPSTGRAKVVFTPGEDAKDFKMPMDVLEDIRGKEPKKP